MDSFNILFQDWFATLFTIMAGIAMLIGWTWFASIRTRNPAHLVPLLICMIVGTAIAIGFVSLMWGGRAYFMAHRTESDNVHAEARAERVQNAREINYDLVDEIRMEREETERQCRLAEDREKNKAARESSEDYFESLKGKGDK